MKKILFLQIKGKSLGGVWFVNKTLAEAFTEKKYKVKVLSIRNDHPGDDIEDVPFDIEVVNEKNAWERTHKGDVLRMFMKKGFFRCLINYFVDYFKLNKDYKTMREMIDKYDPDYIFATHYEVLKGISNKYLSKVLFVQHSSFDYLLSDRNNIKVLKKLNSKIHGFYWLSESALKEAENFGFYKNNFIYNPIKFSTKKRADVASNKKITVISRISEEKRIDLMIDIVDTVFKDPKFKNWKFEIYGNGSFNEKSLSILKDSKQICYKGLTDTPKDALLSSSLTLNTSIYEGFSLSIIEAFECGIPVIAFNFGEAAFEQIINEYNGYIVKDEDEFKEKLIYLMNNLDKLEELSKNSKAFAKKFEIDTIVSKWEKVFLDIDKD